MASMDSYDLHEAYPAYGMDAVPETMDQVPLEQPLVSTVQDQPPQLPPAQVLPPIQSTPQQLPPQQMMPFLAAPLLQQQQAPAVKPTVVADAHMLGIALLLTGIGAAVGLTYGGLYGGVAGGLYGGALVNAFRSARAVTQGTPENDKEATISGTYAVLGAGVATYILWKSHSSDKKKLVVKHVSDDDTGLIGIK